MAEFIELADLAGLGGEAAEASGGLAETSFNIPPSNYVSFNSQATLGSSGNFEDINQALNEYNLVRNDYMRYRNLDSLDMDSLMRGDWRSQVANPEHVLDDLQFGDRNPVDETVPKEVEASRLDRGVRGELPPRNVTFDEVNSEGYRSDFRRSRNFRSRSGRRESFRQDYAPQGIFGQILGREPRLNDMFYADYVGNKANQGVSAIFGFINNVYDMDRTGYLLHEQGKNLRRDRYSLGILFNDKENREDMIGRGKIPAYYSTKNIKNLLRDGIMPFGWNAEMAVQQGFGEDIAAQETRNKTREESNEFLHRESVKAHLKATEGDLKNLRNRLKTRKLVQYYSQF